MKASKVWAIIPAYNEEASIRQVIEKAMDYAENIIVVDDGSADKTSLAAGKTKAHVLKHVVNLGKGAALKTGCDYALRQGAEAMVVLDADAQHDPSEIPKFVAQLEAHDIVFGYRKYNKAMPWILKFGNKAINSATRILYGIRLQDTQCGYRAFTAEAYRKIRWQASDYSMESEMITRAGKNKLSYAEVPIETIYGNKYKGTTVLDGIKIVFNLLWWRWSK
ncbi:glycosyltransferase family 2 protein [Candidatus Woesearchaeota archaeon]|nr:glycosyltransferase family 2 protein [Candidatus Woesearchaeota archaeon]